MHKFYQRLLSILLCLAMVASFAPMIAAADEGELPAETETALIESTEVVVVETEAEEPAAAVAPETVTEILPVGSPTQVISIDYQVAQNENGALVVVESNTSSTVAGASSTLPKLSAPTNLEWGNRYIWEWDDEQQTSTMVSESWPGCISWKPSENSQAHTSVKVYRTANPEEPCWQTTIHYGSTNIPEWRSEELFTASTPESASYYFTITEIGDGINYSDSDTVTSDIWTYTKPAAKLDLCTNLDWIAKHPYSDEGPVPTFTFPANDYVCGYDIDILFAKTADEEPYSIGGILSTYETTTEQGYGFMPDEYIQRNGSGFYYYKIKALSSDITQICNSDWSELSLAYNLTEVVDNVQSELEVIVADKDSLGEDEIRNAVQSMDTTELKNAMLADESVVDSVSALEEQVGGPASVEISHDASDFDAEKISIVGANLNNARSAEDPVKLVISKPEEDHVIDTAYNNSVAVKFSMDLENVEDTENLAVPVKITLPIPETINPDLLVILHYHANGTMEELRYPDSVSIYQKDNQNYASFVLTSFSDFVMTQLTSVAVYRLYNPYTEEHLLTSGVSEKDALISTGWSLDGVAWNAPLDGQPVYRLYNPYDDWHTYTTSQDEIDTLTPLGWTVDGVVSASAESNQLPIYRLFNPYVQTNYHLLTADTAERDLLENAGWLVEGIAWYGLK